MQMMIASFLVLLFFVVIPGLGAFYTRSQWRRFRRSIVDASLIPVISYQKIFTKQEGYEDEFRFIGSLEAIQGDYIWLRNEDLSLSADLKRSHVYVLPSYSYPEEEGFVEQNRETLPDEMPHKIAWNRIFSLPEGTKMFISGPFRTEHGKGMFRGTKTNPLTVVIYDGAERTILRRSIWGGRQRNEYWNFLTPGSLAAGSFSLFILGYILLRSPYLVLPAIFSFTASLIPVLIFAPPGILFFILYRNLWRRSRFLRAERDLLQLPLRYFQKPLSGTPTAETFLPDGSMYCMYRIQNIDLIDSPEVKENLKIRTVSLIQHLHDKVNDYYMFGSLPEQGSGFPVTPEDPMAEYLIIPGNPEELSLECAHQARKFEIQAILAYSLGLGGNFILVFVMLRLFFT